MAISTSAAMAAAISLDWCSTVQWTVASAAPIVARLNLSCLSWWRVSARTEFPSTFSRKKNRNCQSTGESQSRSKPFQLFGGLLKNSLLQLFLALDAVPGPGDGLQSLGVDVFATGNT